ncbi:M24 family metallopeptidase [Streptomyces sp. 891-h]|uniref:M24 family metallopeptidase n=1 Tax=Streptomyces sp. 891-h TaxID=2720714 RepID=UPI001FAA50B6|nr:M24 family metallopeptidase [Streptomyces sp. 891-h]
MRAAKIGYSSTDLRGFREVQQLAYACAESVAARLKPGVTEREAARMQREWLRERGVRDWFHLPFAWFGDRTAAPQPGLWAVEPHLGFRGTGAKFEEVLVVTGSGDPQESAFWLDDDLPWRSPRASAFERGGVRRRQEEAQAV